MDEPDASDELVDCLVFRQREDAGVDGGFHVLAHPAAASSVFFGGGHDAHPMTMPMTKAEAMTHQLRAANCSQGMCG